jgi:hypothetical protein
LKKLRSFGLRQPERLDGIAILLRSHARSQAQHSDGAPAVHLVRAVSFYRSKFLDRLRGAVANSYPNVDLLWHNVITGPWGTHKVSDSRSSLSAGHEPTAGADHEEIDGRAALCCTKKGGQGQG